MILLTHFQRLESAILSGKQHISKCPDSMNLSLQLAVFKIRIKYDTGHDKIRTLKIVKIEECDLATLNEVQ